MVLGVFRNCLGVFARRGTCEEVLGDRRVDVHVSSATPGCILAVSSRSSIPKRSKAKTRVWWYLANRNMQPRSSMGGGQRSSSNIGAATGTKAVRRRGSARDQQRGMQACRGMQRVTGRWRPRRSTVAAGLGQRRGFHGVVLVSWMRQREAAALKKRGGGAGTPATSRVRQRSCGRLGDRIRPRLHGSGRPATRLDRSGGLVPWWLEQGGRGRRGRQEARWGGAAALGRRWWPPAVSHP